MQNIEYLKGTVFAKKVGDRVQIFDGVESVGDESPVMATGTTTPRMLKDRFADVANVKDFGAKGDGVTDDTEAFAQATATGKTIYVPQGIYLVSESLQGNYIGDHARIITAVGQNGFTIGNLVLGAGCTLLGHDIGSKDFYENVDLLNTQLTCLGRGCGRNLSIDADTTTAIGQGCLSGETLDDDLSDYSLYTGFDNVVIGFHAGKRLTSGDSNVGIGRDAINSLTDGSGNTAVGGAGCLQQLIHGNSNTCIGNRAGMRMGTTVATGGSPRISTVEVNNNTFIGESAGREHREGVWNTYIGQAAGRGITSPENQYTGTSTGQRNTVVGGNAFSSVTTGSANTISGQGAFSAGSSGNDNCIYGKGAGSMLTTTNNSVILGSNAAGTSLTANDSIIIGYKAGYSVSNLDNQILIGGSGGLPYLSGTMASDANYLRVDASFTPSTGGKYNLGSGSYKWSAIFADSGTIVTSDEREKTLVNDIDEAVFKAWAKVNYKVFKYKDAVNNKGDEARLHIGVIAQQVIDAFASEGLDATHYGLLCYDKWEDKYVDVAVVDQPEVLDANGEVVTPAVTHTERRKVLEAGDRYGIRYEEALALECAYLRWRLNKIDNQQAVETEQSTLAKVGI